MSDKRDNTTPRRPLPNPSASPTSSKQPINEASVAPTNFYSSNKPPPLPSRPTSVTTSPGSGHTRYKPPSPPPYHHEESTPFREPVLVSEEPISDPEELPELIQSDTHSNEQSPWSSGPDQWSSNSWNESTNYRGLNSGWDGIDTDSGWAGGSTDHADWTTIPTKGVEIDGTEAHEEINWWDASVRQKNRRPGPGVLPPLLEDIIHDPDHTLYSVKVDPPDLAPRPSTGSLNAPSPDLSRTSSTSSGSQSSSSSPPPPPPSNEDLISAVPHPNAYYCRRHNGWAILQWKLSSTLPPFAKSFKPVPDNPLPDQNRRIQRKCCIEGERGWGGNKTHHFHIYPEAVSAHKLTPPFYRREWEKAVKAKERRRRMTTLDMDVATDFIASDKMDEDATMEEDEGDLLDLYICCQCSLYCVVSKVIPGVVPPKHIEEFVRSKKDHPAIERNGEESVVAGWETVLTVLENKLWKGEARTLPVTRPTFQRKMGWNPNVQRIFEALGFRLDVVKSPNSTNPQGDTALFPPSTSSTTTEGRQNRAKLLRAWVEISAWLADYVRRFSNTLKDYTIRKLHVSLLAAREMYQSGLGAHNDQIPRTSVLTNLTSHGTIVKAFAGLGLTPTTYTPELLIFAYMAQCRCDPAQTPQYFTWFFNIIQVMQEFRLDVPTELQTAVMEERSRNRYTQEDLHKAIANLGFGAEGPLGLDFDDDITDDFIENAWRDKVRRAWREKDGGYLQRDANESFRILAETRGSVVLRRMWEESNLRAINPTRAYSTLEIPEDVEEAMLLTVFSLRVEEQPSQGDKMREALAVIAEVRDSARLRQFLETGADPGEVVIPTRADMPRGLNQLGNTCYLNSLLQYFYTIKELRDAVAPLANTGDKSLDNEKLSDDALKHHRVGGRLVTRREVGRSKKFVSQLANLFFELEYHQNPSITPTIELAKLALVTSRDEEDDEVDRGGTDSSNDTDATLVEDAPSRITDQTPHSPLLSPGSILGKRVRDGPLQKNEMDIDNPQQGSDSLNKDGFVMISSPISPLQTSSPQPEGTSSKAGEVIDVEMQDVTKSSSKAPRKSATANSDSVMMFGKQHDVSECMDNCMFQIETALLKFDGLSGPEDGKGSIVKRLFYGKIRQRLAAVDSKSRSSVHEKEDLFSHLPVNVAEDGFDLYDGLSGYFDDIVDFEGKKARMEVSLVDLPPLLQVQLQRVQFNRETLQPYKSQAYVKFGETIYMDRFLDGADQSKKSRSKAIQRELNRCRERVNTLTHGKHAPFAEAISSTLGFLAKHEGLASSQLDDELVAQLNSEQEILKVEIDDLRSQVVKLKEDLEAVWRTETNASYELTSVFVHRGSSPSWGHYFFYSRNLPGQPDAWFKYNDSDVSEVSKDEVLADTTGSTANPYLLVFARKGSEVIETVNRFDPDNLIEADA